MSWAWLLDHLIVMPILVPMVTGAALLFIGERQRTLKAVIDLLATTLLLVLGINLLLLVDAEGGAAAARIYRVGNWPVPFGIMLYADRLSALMIILAATLALAASVFSVVRWHRASASFHSLVQFLLMGLCGAFLTGDLFNLFVFFEVLLAASYGLVLHGSGPRRVRAGLHYIAVNLVSSLLFLIGVSLIYGVTGTLNMADLAQRIPAVAAEDRGLLEAGAGILGIAFLVKAGMWPLNFWLPTTYAAASAPAAALFAILSKVGVYVLLRLSLLFFGDGTGPSAGFGSSLLLYGGLATIIFGTIGVLASQGMAHLVGFSVLVSSGTLLACIGIGHVGVTSGALFYLVSSTLTIGALFLLVELVERARTAGADILAVTMEAYGEDGEELEHEEEEVGIAIPSTLAVLGVCFSCAALLLAGMPPFSGFVAKFAMMHALLLAPADAGISPAVSWVLVALLIISGFAALIAMTRTGISTFWASLDGVPPRVRLAEILPVGILLFLGLALSVQGGPVLHYLDATAAALHAPQSYLGGAGLSQPPLVVPEAGG